MSGASPMPYFALYSASKSMLTNFFTALNYELKKTGVNITVVMPGGVYTRPDIIEDIKGQGLWGKLSAIRPEVVSEKSIKKSKKNKARYIPGFFNKFLYFAIKILPKKIVLNFIARRWKKISKDAF
jgi:short-subunit dehydrogenase